MRCEIMRRSSRTQSPRFSGRRCGLLCGSTPSRDVRNPRPKPVAASLSEPERDPNDPDALFDYANERIR